MVRYASIRVPKKYSGKTVTKETKAQYRRCAPADIEDAVRKQVKGVYSEYEDKLKAKPVIIDIDVQAQKEKINGYDCELAEIMERGVNGILAEPYKKNEGIRRGCNSFRKQLYGIGLKR